MKIFQSFVYQYLISIFALVAIAAAAFAPMAVWADPYVFPDQATYDYGIQNSGPPLNGGSSAQNCTGAGCVKAGLDVTANQAGVKPANAAGTDLPTILGNAINYIFGVVGVIFLTIILVGGYQWMTAGGSEEKVGKAKAWIINGVNGMIVIFLAYALAYVMLFALKGSNGG